MEKMNDLNDLLKHEIMDLCSAEDQIIAAMPAMIEKAGNAQLKKSLQQHLRITEQQRKRLDQVQHLLGQAEKEEERGLLERLFKGKQTCRGMEGLIDEGKKVMKEDMDPDVMDAAIIASAQKIEHYEICGYGTARSFALQLGLQEVAGLLNETLDEEYESDRLLSEIAETGINKEAVSGGNNSSNVPQPRSGSKSRSRISEPEMEMVSSPRKASGSTGRSGASSGSSSGANAPKGGSARDNGSSGRTSSPAKKSASSKTSSSRSASIGRSASSEGGRSRSK
ncbi:MAG: ferritin-like domain-containing protein [Flavisolibacter sp.]|jgi:ferritin-like metal-binding protein YciE|nr:ferritin-like domain-containing protein [Flavisolibacter sp.]